MNGIDPYGLKGRGGILIPIRNYIKKYGKAGDVLGPIIDQVIDLPYTPWAAFFYIMGPKDTSQHADYVPLKWDPRIPLVYDPLASIKDLPELMEPDLPTPPPKLPWEDEDKGCN